MQNNAKTSMILWRNDDHFHSFMIENSYQLLKHASNELNRARNTLKHHIKNVKSCYASNMLKHAKTSVILWRKRRP